jgi:hypothetical protein
LKHEVSVPHGARVARYVEKQWSGYVVGQVSHDAQVLPHCGEIEFERIAVMNGQSIRPMARAQIRDDIAVYLDYVEMLEPLQ